MALARPTKRADELSLIGREQALEAAREADPIAQQLRMRAWA